MKNQIMLNTYADSLGQNLTELHELLDGPLKGTVGGVHILPFFPSSADRGFAPIRYDVVDDKFGDFSDVQSIGREYALMFDFNDSRALQIPPDFSRQMPAMLPEAVQGRPSAASRFVGETDPAVTMRYNGPNPPDKDHEYYLHVWGTSKQLPGLNQGFWLNELQHAIRDCGETPDQGGIFLTGKA